MSSVPESLENHNSHSSRERRAINLHDGPPNLFVEVDGHASEFHPSDLEGEGQTQAIRERWTAVHGPVIFDLRNALRWDHDTRWQVQRFIADTQVAYEVRIAHGGQCFSNLFDAWVELLRHDGDSERIERARRGAVESAAITYANSLQIACSRIADVLRELRVRGFRVETLIHEARAALRALRGLDSPTRDTVYVGDILPDAPAGADCVVPPNWQISQDGISKTQSERHEILLSCPLILCRRLIDTSERKELLEMAWQRDGRWQRRNVARAMVATPRTLVELADLGLPVNAINAREVIQYLADFERVNVSSLPVVRVTSRMGWQHLAAQQDGSHCEFLCGRHAITFTNAVHAGSAEQQTIEFRGADDGDEQLVDGFRDAGSFEAWRDAMRSLEGLPRVRVAVYAALSAAMLAIVHAYNFVLNFSGTTSQGKSTTLRIAASVWGNPDERSPSAAIGTWDSTRVWIERVREIQNDLPIILDDTKRAGRPEDIAQTIYDVASGRGRGRGSIDGVRHTGTFRTVMISSGEAPLTSFTRDGGTRARVMEMWGSPFQSSTAETGALVTSINEAIRTNFGHAGPQFVGFLIAHRDRWQAWQQTFVQLRQHFTGRANGNAVAIRIADYCAVLALTEQLAIEAGCVPWTTAGVVDELWPAWTAETAEADQAAAALRAVWAWCCANESQFRGRRSGSDGPPHGGWAGRWDPEPSGLRVSGERFIGFLRPRIEEILHEYGHEPEPVIRNWRDRGWLRVSQDRQYYRARLDDKPVDLVAIEMTAIDRLLGPDPESQPDGVTTRMPQP